jgi:hypothetical protein
MMDASRDHSRVVDIQAACKKFFHEAKKMHKKADLLERFKLGTRLIYFFGDNREQIKYYNPKSDIISDPKKGISIKLEDLWGGPENRRLIMLNGVMVLVNEIEYTKYFNQMVYEANDLLGQFVGVTAEGMMRIRRADNHEFFIDPTQCVISSHLGGRLFVEEKPV